MNLSLPDSVSNITQVTIVETLHEMPTMMLLQDYPTGLNIKYKESDIDINGYKKATLVNYNDKVLQYFLCSSSFYYDNYQKSNNTRGSNLGNSLTDTIRSISEFDFSGEIKQNNLNSLTYLEYGDTKWSLLCKFCNKVRGKVWGINEGKLKFFDRILPVNNPDEYEILNVPFQYGWNSVNSSSTDIESENFSPPSNVGFNFRCRDLILPVSQYANQYINLDEVRGRMEHLTSSPVCMTKFTYRFDSANETRTFNIGDRVRFSKVPHLTRIPFMIQQVSHNIILNSTIEDYVVTCISYNYDYFIEDVE